MPPPESRLTRGPCPLGVVLLIRMSCALADRVEMCKGDRQSGALLRKDGEDLVLRTDFAGEVKLRLADVAKLTTDGSRRPPVDGAGYDSSGHYRWRRLRLPDPLRRKDVAWTARWREHGVEGSLRWSRMDLSGPRLGPRLSRSRRHQRAELLRAQEGIRGAGMYGNAVLRTRTVCVCRWATASTPTLCSKSIGTAGRHLGGRGGTRFRC